MNDDIYNKKLITLAKSKNGAGELNSKENFVSLDNPLCGDRVRLAVDVQEGRIVSVVHNVRGCLLCKAAASAIGAAAPGMKTESMLQVCRHMAAMLKGDVSYTPLNGWEALTAFEPVQPHKNRHLCVLLPFQAVAMVLKNDTSEKV